MKYFKLIIIGINLLGYVVSAQNNTNEMTTWKLELLTTYDFLNTSYGTNNGFIAKGKYNLYHSKHFSFYTGIMHQNSYINERKNKFTKHTRGYTTDVGLYALTEIVYYPFKQRKFFMSIEPFVGATYLRSKGSLKIPAYGVSETYKNTYVYFNYGVSNSLGYRFGKISVQLSLWSSLKGFWDKGRFRPGDFDSRIFAALGVGYSF